MMYDEFITLSGIKIPYNVYNEIIEPLYMNAPELESKHDFISRIKSDNTLLNIMIDYHSQILSDANKILTEANIKTLEADKILTEANLLKKKFEINKEYWEEIRKSLDWAAYELSDKLGY